jgi:hypothetical protein
MKKAWIQCLGPSEPKNEAEARRSRRRSVAQWFRAIAKRADDWASLLNCSFYYIISGFI